jgi:hypothetical protein
MSAEQTVNDIITDARTFAQESFESANALISSAQSAAASFVLLEPRQLNFDAPDAITFSNVGDPGQFEDGFTVPGGKPESPNDDLASLYLPTIPVFPDPPPALDTEGLFDIDRPQYNIGEFGGTPPETDTDIPLPAVPELQEYEEPETNPLDLRDTPVVNAYPTFDSDAVTISDPGVPPDAAAEYKARVNQMIPEFRDWVESYADGWINKYAPDYFSAMEQLETRISEGYAGNTAMPDAVEQQIFDRGVSRAEQERGPLDAEAAERFARRGYSLPPIALNTEMAANHQAVARNAANVARDVAIERARLEHQHVQFVMQLSSTIRDGMRGQVLQYAGLLIQINGQAIEDARSLGALLVQVYELLVRKSQNEQEWLRTLAGVYEAELKSALVDLEIFKVEAETAKLRKDAELADVDVWAKKIEAQEQKIQLYVAQLRGVTEQVSLERLKVETFGSEVDAYSALVRSKEAEFNAYRAAISGDEALVRAYAEQVGAYSAEVDAARVKVQAESAVTDAGVQYNRSLIDIFKAELDSWTAEINAEETRFSSSSDAYKTQLEAFAKRIDIQIEQQRSIYDAAQLDLRAQVAQTRADVQTLLAQANLFQRRIENISQTAIAGANAQGSMASSAVSAQNTMVNLVNETLNP